MHLGADQPVPTSSTVRLTLDEKRGRWASDQIPQSRTYRDGHGHVDQVLPTKQQLRQRDRQQRRQPRFVATYMEATTRSPVQMKKGDFVPHVFEPEHPLLPLPGAALTASQYLFLEREQHAQQHVTVSAELRPLSKKSNRKRRSLISSTGSTSDKHGSDRGPDWKSVEHFKNWQNRVLQAEMQSGR